MAQLSPAQNEAFQPFGDSSAWASALRTVLGALADRYGIRPAVEVRDLGGTFKRNLLVQTAPDGMGARDEAQVVVHVHRPFITTARIGVVHEAVRALDAVGVPVPRRVHELAGEAFITVEGHVVDVDRYVPNEGLTDSWPRFLAAVPLLACIHDAHDVAARVSAVPPVVRLYGTPAELLEMMEGTVRAVHAQQETERHASGEEAERARVLCDRGMALLTTLDRWWRTEGSTLPGGLTHGDFGTNNVLYRGDEPVAVIDFDLLDVRQRTYDLARAFRWTLRRAEPAFAAAAGGTSEGSTAEGGSSAVQLVAGHLRETIAAYNQASARPLSEAERVSLPLQIARVPLYDLAEVGAYVDPRLAGPVQAILRQAASIEQSEWLVHNHEAIAERLK